MKKIFIKFLCLACLFIFVLTSCNSTTNINKKSDFNIDEEEYIISFSMVGGYAGNCYTFILTPDNRLLAEYKTGKTTQQVEIKLNEHQIGLMEERINEVLTLTEDDIEFFVGISDYWRCTISYNDIEASFDYGVSKSPSVNILLEQMLGCCDSEKSLKTEENLQSRPPSYRAMMTYFATLEEEE